MRVTLYTTDGCHLCEQAIGMFYYANQHQHISANYTLNLVDIIDEEQLVALYGEKIPVFYRPDNQSQLFWPIELEVLIDWLNR